jgi:hypothetical protein
LIGDAALAIGLIAGFVLAVGLVVVSVGMVVWQFLFG